MEKFMQHDIQRLKQFSKNQSEQKAIKILLSISIFSLLISTPFFLPFLSHSFNQFLSSFSFEISSYTTDRNCIFLLCNGILVFLIKNSGLFGNSPPDNSQLKEDDHQLHDQSIKQFLEVKSRVSEDVSKKAGEVKGKETRRLVKAEDIENWLLNSKDEAEEDEDDFLSADEEEEEGSGVLSTEELNKKCEDFIKKMKEGIKIEAKAHSQQVIIVKQ